MSYSKKFVLFSPWKTASSTARVRLNLYNEYKGGWFFHFNPVLNRVVHKHLICADFIALPEAKLDLYSASFVRNPYDRVWSGFKQIERDIHTQYDADYPTPWIQSLVREQLTSNREQLRAADYDFDKWVALLREDQIFESGRNTSFPLHPATYWTHVNGEQYVKFIGRVENFETDFAKLLSRLGLEPENSNNANVAAQPEEGVGNRYVPLMSNKSIARINELFAVDFEVFDYKMA